tara:strand:- start:145 stop:318 length:174 start_codon:yes stop_codon:yes gene_type:complete
MSKALIIGIVIFVITWVWITYEICTAPIMPDDFELKEEDIWPLDERPNIEEDANKEN